MTSNKDAGGALADETGRSTADVFDGAKYAVITNYDDKGVFVPKPECQRIAAALRTPALPAAGEVREVLEKTYDALSALKSAIEASGKMNGREYIDLGIQVNNALDKAHAALALPQSKEARTVPGEAGREALAKELDGIVSALKMGGKGDEVWMANSDADTIARAAVALHSPSVTGAGALRELDCYEFMPLSLVPLADPNHDPGEHQVMDAETAYIFKIMGSRERAERIVAALNAAALAASDRE